MIGIYSITNLLDGKRYIGQSVTVEARIRNHKRELLCGKHANTYLQRAYTKYGSAAFSFDVLCECAEDELDARERAWIEWYDTMNKGRGYNRESGGHLLKHLSEETRKKLSGVQRRGSNGMKGKHHSEETRRKMSEAHRPPFTAEHRRKIGEASRGKTVSEETRRKISEARKAQGPRSEETRKKISEAKKGKKRLPFTAEHRKKMSESLRVWNKRKEEQALEQVV